MAISKPTRLGFGISILSQALLYGLALVLVISVVHNAAVDWSQGWARPSPASNEMPEQDFANLWLAGRLAREGHLTWLYAAPLFETWRNHVFGGRLAPEPWIYPPTVLLLGVPLSYLPLLAAYLLWDISTLVVAVLLLRHARLSWIVVLVGLGAPATWRSLILGQYGVITGALVVSGLLIAVPRPGQAGIMLGLCTLKPQQAVIVPVAWIATGNWRAIGAAGAVFTTMVLAIVLWQGTDAWMLFLTQSRSSMHAILEAPLPQPYINTGVSVFWMAHTFGLGLPTSYVLQGVAAVTASILAYRAWSLSDADPVARMAVTVCLCLLVTPYGYTSDMVAYSVAVTTVVANNGWRIRLLDGLLWLWPGYCPLITSETGLLFTPIAVALTATLAWKQMKDRSHPNAAPA